MIIPFVHQDAQANQLQPPQDVRHLLPGCLRWGRSGCCCHTLGGEEHCGQEGSRQGREMKKQKEEHKKYNNIHIT